MKNIQEDRRENAKLVRSRTDMLRDMLREETLPRAHTKKNVIGSCTRKEMESRRGRTTTRWEDSCKRDMENVIRRTYWTGQSGRMTFKTTPATPDDGKSPRRKIRKTQKDNCNTINGTSYLKSVLTVMTRATLSAISHAIRSINGTILSSLL